MEANERRQKLRGPREERLFVRVLFCDTDPELEGSTLSCSTLDVSPVGLKLAVDRVLPAGARLQLWVELKGRAGKFLLSGVVRWCSEEATCVICGIELQENQDLSDLTDWKELFG